MCTDNYKVVTFVSHYGASVFAKSISPDAVLRPVPRALSSSCGSCVFVPDEVSVEKIVKTADSELIEAVYSSEKNRFVQIWSSENIRV